jgi:cytoskeletal protein CcmA (bactofilin family)
MVSGRFDGSIEAERLEIVASGVVSGTVTVAQLVIESGAQFNGTSKIKGKEPPRQIGHDGGKNKAAPETEKQAEKA